MLHKRLEIPKDNYYVIMSKLGSIKYSLEFEDLNKNQIETSKPHFSIINRCDEIESIFNHIDDILINHCNIKYDLYNNYDDFQSHLNFDINKNGQNVLEKNYLDYILKSLGHYIPLAIRILFYIFFYLFCKDFWMI